MTKEVSKIIWANTIWINNAAFNMLLLDPHMFLKRFFKLNLCLNNNHRNIRRCPTARQSLTVHSWWQRFHGVRRWYRHRDRRWELFICRLKVYSILKLYTLRKQVFISNCMKRKRCVTFYEICPNEGVFDTVKVCMKECRQLKKIKKCSL